jgi:hypothetical protein
MVLYVDDVSDVLFSCVDVLCYCTAQSKTVNSVPKADDSKTVSYLSPQKFFSEERTNVYAMSYKRGMHCKVYVLKGEKINHNNPL